MVLSRFRIRRKRPNLQEAAAASPNRRRRPRLIGQDPHRLLTHAERAGWIGGKRELLAVWRDYAEDFIRSRPMLPVEERRWLMSHGFDKDAAWLYGLPGEHAESYISSLQSRLMPQINGLDSPLLANRALFMQTFRDQLPWPVPLAQAIGGRLLRNEAGVADWLAMAEGRRSCIRPAFVSSGPVSIFPAGSSPLASWLGGEQSLSMDNASTQDNQLMGLAPVSEWLGESERVRSHRFKLLLLRAPRSRKFSLIAACLVLGSQNGTFEDDTVSVQIDPTSGQPQGAVQRYPERVVARLEEARWGDCRLPSTPAPGWADFTGQLLESLNGLPLLEWLQVEADLSTDGFTLLDATDNLDSAAYQVHRPLMDSKLCQRFMMEYCL